MTKKIDKKMAILNALKEQAKPTNSVELTKLLSLGGINFSERTVRFHLKELDEKGLTPLDRSYLKTVIDFYHGGPVGIEAIAATLQEETDTLVDVVEPYLLKIGMLLRTSSGRKAAQSAYRHLGYATQDKMF